MHTQCQRRHSKAPSPLREGWGGGEGIFVGTPQGIGPRLPGRNPATRNHTLTREWGPPVRGGHLRVRFSWQPPNFWQHPRWMSDTHRHAVMPESYIPNDPLKHAHPTDSTRIIGKEFVHHEAWSRLPATPSSAPATPSPRPSRGRRSLRGNENTNGLIRQYVPKSGDSTLIIHKRILPTPCAHSTTDPGNALNAEQTSELTQRKGDGILLRRRITFLGCQHSSSDVLSCMVFLQLWNNFEFLPSKSLTISKNSRSPNGDIRLRTSRNALVKKEISGTIMVETNVADVLLYSVGRNMAMVFKQATSIDVHKPDGFSEIVKT